MAFRILVYYVLTLMFTFMLGGLQEAQGFSSMAIILPQLAPGLGALSTMWIFSQDGVHISLFNRDIPITRFVLAVLTPAVTGVIIFLINSLAFDMVTFPPSLNGGEGLLLWMPLGAMGEELGWRAYLHRKLDPAISGLGSSLLVGAFWAVWHIGLYANGLLYMVFFIMLMMSYSVVMYALLADVKFNLLLAVLFHWVINLTNLFSLSVINELDFMIVNSLVWALIAAGIVFVSKNRFLTGKTAL